MASAYYSNTVHIDFASVLAMENPGIVSVLNALMDSGLEGFLGCPTVIYESELIDFFNNGSVRDGLVVSTMNGVPVEFLKQLFAETFELPVDGLADLSDIPKDKIFDARSIVSLSGEPVSLSGRKGQMKIEYRLLCDIMAKSISVKAGSFNALTLRSSHKQLSTGIVTTVLDVVDIRRVVKETHQELIAKINSLDEQVAATRNDLLEFSAQAQQSLNVITTQLSELVAYINRGGDNKKGESSSRGPQSQSQPPPSDVQNLESGQFISLEEAAERIRSADAFCDKENQQVATVILDQPILFEVKYFKRPAGAYRQSLKPSAIVHLSEIQVISSCANYESIQTERFTEFAQIWYNAKFALTLCDLPLGGTEGLYRSNLLVIPSEEEEGET
ncbi:dystroglycan-like [Dorcoceras hygrometricum]|uniref:Dystroglycan-like n=1 Tax=Dorcoceras hygrometricum TaxID=472368 RepID=A0A2Z7CUI1_9LAMI|nr:dystroglycan-like [Dorcoceras hygrometricum]